MKKTRFIPRLDVKGPRLVKGIYYEGWRDLGNPVDFAEKYYLEGADEILYLDIFASLTQRNALYEVIKSIAEKVYVPITVGGGVRSIDDIKKSLRYGADKVAINTNAVKKPSLIKDASRKFGSQCIVISIEAKKRSCGYEVYVDHGRNPSGIDAVEWARTAEELGAGELLVSSVDFDGAYRGFDLNLIKQISSEVSIPVIAGSGASSPENIKQVIESGADAVTVASLLHYNKYSISEIKNYLLDKNVPMRIT